MKKQVFGGVLFCLSIITVLLSRIIGFELDVFYVVISIAGAGLFLYGVMQRHQHVLSGARCEESSGASGSRTKPRD